MRSLLLPALLGSVGLVAACGSGFSAGSGGSGTTTVGTSSSSGTGTGTTSTSGTGGATTTSTSSTSTSSTSTSSTTTVTTTTTTTVTSGCPDEEGSYSVTEMGLGCGDLVTTLPQCIKKGSGECQYDIVYNASGTVLKGVAGTVSVGPMGGFGSGTIDEGSAQRTGCVGVWKPGSGITQATLTIDCGGMGTSQSCRVVLSRTGDGCGF